MRGEKRDLKILRRTQDAELSFYALIMGKRSLSISLSFSCSLCLSFCLSGSLHSTLCVLFSLQLDCFALGVWFVSRMLDFSECHLEEVGERRGGGATTLHTFNFWGFFGLRGVILFVALSEVGSVLPNWQLSFRFCNFSNCLTDLFSKKATTDKFSLSFRPSVKRQEIFSN